MKDITLEEINKEIARLTLDLEFIHRERQNFIAVKKHLEKSLIIVNQKIKNFDREINDKERKKDNYSFCKYILTTLTNLDDKKVGNGYINNEVKHILEEHGYSIKNYNSGTKKYEIQKKLDDQVFKRR